MFPFGFPNWAWNWGWVAFIGFIILLGIFLLPWFFFLLNLQTLLKRVSDQNRAMPAGHVWLNFIPIFNLGWFIYTVMKVSDSVSAEYRSRGWAPEGDFGYRVGLAAGILAIVSFFLGWVPVIGWGTAIAELICWIIYWLKTSELKNQLASQEMWRRPVPPPYGYPGPVGPSTGPGTAPYQTPSAWQPPADAPAPPPWAPQAGPSSPAAAAPAASAPASGPPEAVSPRAEPAVVESAEETPAASGAPAGGPLHRQCAGCGTEFDPSDRFCRTCGLPLPRR